jgi:hypothetical protein
MGIAIIPIALFTVFWGIIGIVLPFCARKAPNGG